MKYTLKAGSARISITPPLGTELSGFWFKPASVINDDLYANAIVLKYGNVKLCIIQCDIIAFDTVWADIIRGAVANTLNIGVEYVMLAASHTHSGPSTVNYRQWGALNVPYIEVLKSKLVTLAHDAADTMKAAIIGFGNGRADIGCNRISDENITDNEVTVMRIDDIYGNPIVTIVNYACHPVAMHGIPGIISADLPWIVRCEMERRLGMDSNIVYFTGCCGDVQPKELHSVESTKKYGKILADAVYKTFKEIKMSSAVPELATFTQEFCMPFMPLPEEGILLKEINRLKSLSSKSEDLPSQISIELSGVWQQEVEITLDWAEEKLNFAHTYKEREAILTEVNNRLECGLLLDWAEEALKCLSAGKEMEFMVGKIQLFTIGPFAILALPAEVSVEIGIWAKERAKTAFDTLFISTLTNGAYGYIMLPKHYDKGCYEVTFAPKVYGIAEFKPCVGEHLKDSIELVLRKSSMGRIASETRPNSNIIK